MHCGGSSTACINSLAFSVKAIRTLGLFPGGVSAVVLTVACGGTNEVEPTPALTPAPSPTSSPTAVAAPSVAPLTTWSYDGTTHSVASGIAVPLIGYTYWDPTQLKQIVVPDGEGVAVYLSDQQISCHDYPFFEQDRFPQLPTAQGATITINLPEKTRDYRDASFDVVSQGSEAGASTDRVSGGFSVKGAGDERQVEGWLEYDSAEHYPDTRRVEAEGSFDVPLCS